MTNDRIVEQMLHRRPVPPEMNIESRRLILPPEKNVGTTLDFATSDTVLRPGLLEISKDLMKDPASNIVESGILVERHCCSFTMCRMRKLQ